MKSTGLVVMVQNALVKKLRIPMTTSCGPQLIRWAPSSYTGCTQCATPKLPERSLWTTANQSSYIIVVPKSVNYVTSNISRIKHFN